MKQNNFSIRRKQLQVVAAPSAATKELRSAIDHCVTAIGDVVMHSVQLWRGVRTGLPTIVFALTLEQLKVIARQKQRAEEHEVRLRKREAALRASSKEHKNLVLAWQLDLPALREARIDKKNFEDALDCEIVFTTKEVALKTRLLQLENENRDLRSELDRKRVAAQKKHPSVKFISIPMGGAAPTRARKRVR